MVGVLLQAHFFLEKKIVGTRLWEGGGKNLVASTSTEFTEGVAAKMEENVVRTLKWVNRQ